MAWTSPGTVTSGTLLTAAFWNAQVRDNLNETAPAKATTAGAYFATSSTNTIVQRVGQRQTDTNSGTTTSTSFTDLTGALTGPRVTATTGTLALVLWGCQAQNNTANTSVRISVEVTGASSSSASDIRALIFDGMPAAQPCQASHTVFYDDLTAGSNTWTMKYRVGGGTGTFERRRLIVFPY